MNEAATKRVKKIEKWLYKIDNEYLLKKTIENYDKKAVSLPKTEMD